MTYVYTRDVPTASEMLVRLADAILMCRELNYYTTSNSRWDLIEDIDRLIAEEGYTVAWDKEKMKWRKF